MTAKFSCQGYDQHIINHHAPQSGCPNGGNHKHWGKLEKALNKVPSTCPVIIPGDTNARLYGRMNELEEEAIGPHAFCLNKEHIHQLKSEEFENRQELVDFCIKNGLVISNTFFEKQPRKKC